MGCTRQASSALPADPLADAAAVHLGRAFPAVLFQRLRRASSSTMLAQRGECVMKRPARTIGSVVMVGLLVGAVAGACSAAGSGLAAAGVGGASASGTLS